MAPQGRPEEPLLSLSNESHPDGDSTPERKGQGQQLDVIDQVFEKGDRIGPMAALIDGSILAVGILVALLWQSTVSSHHKSASQTQAWKPTEIAASKVAATLPPPTPKVVTRTICSAVVTERTSTGKTHSSEYKGTCKYLHSVLDQSKLQVHWLPARTVTYTQTGS